MRDDAIIIGGGHNGLVCAFYLARARMRVRVLERRGVVGGAAVTEEFHPGFRNSVAAYTVSLLQPRVIADMRLAAHGLRVVPRAVANFCPQGDGDALTMGGGLAATQAEVARFSQRDAARLPAYLAELEAIADVLRALALRAPPNVGGGAGALVAALKQSRGVRALPLSRQRALLAIFTRSAREYLDGWFESDALKAALGFDSIVGHYASPDHPGSAYVLLHHVFGEVGGEKGAWGHALGGMGAITSAMRAACEGVGVAIETDAPVARVLVERGRAVGVAAEDGREHRAAVVAANVGPKLLFERLVPAEALTPEFRTAITAYKMGSGSFRMNVALSSLPRFMARPEPGLHLEAGIIMAPTLDYMDRAYADARTHGMAREPIVEMLIPSMVDASLAPPGGHVASLFAQQFAPVPPGGRSWDDAKTEAIDRTLAVVERHAPGFRASILGQVAYTPLDLERTFGLTGGDIFHGRMSLDQLFSARPLLGHAGHRAPIAGLYMCGAGTHPGGGVTGAPGHNAARAILADRGWLGRLGRAFRRQPVAPAPSSTGR